MKKLTTTTLEQFLKEHDIEWSRHLGELEDEGIHVLSSEDINSPFFKIVDDRSLSTGKTELIEVHKSISYFGLFGVVNHETPDVKFKNLSREWITFQQRNLDPTLIDKLTARYISERCAIEFTYDEAIRNAQKAKRDALNTLELQYPLEALDFDK